MTIEIAGVTCTPNGLLVGPVEIVVTGLSIQTRHLREFILATRCLLNTDLAENCIVTLQSANIMKDVYEVPDFEALDLNMCVADRPENLCE